MAQEHPARVWQGGGGLLISLGPSAPFRNMPWLSPSQAPCHGAPCPTPPCPTHLPTLCSNYVSYKAIAMSFFRLFFPHAAVFGSILKWLRLLPREWRGRGGAAAAVMRIWVSPGPGACDYSRTQFVPSCCCLPFPTTHAA